jgi:hypothetical protein
MSYPMSMKIKNRTKKAKIPKIKTIRPKIIEQELKPIDEHGYPIKRSKICSICGEKFYLSFSFSQQNYSLRNFLSY